MRASSSVLALALAIAGARASADTPSGALRAPPESAPTVARDFEVADLARAQRAAIATLQDLGFAIESADLAQGLVAGSRLDRHPLRLTVRLVATSESSISATVSCDYAGAPVANALPAEAFLAAYAVVLSPPVEF